jgi:hypothetical protein
LLKELGEGTLFVRELRALSLCISVGSRNSVV